MLDTLRDNGDINAVDYVLPTKSTYSTFDSSDMEILCLLLSKIRSVSPSCIKTNTVFQRYSSIVFQSRTIGQAKTGRNSSSPNIIIAKWDVGLFGQPPTRLTEPDFPGSMFRPVKVHHFAKATFSVGSFCCCSYFLVLTSSQSICIRKTSKSVVSSYV